MGHPDTIAELLAMWEKNHPPSILEWVLESLVGVRIGIDFLKCNTVQKFTLQGAY